MPMVFSCTRNPTTLPPNPHEISKPEVFWCFQGLRKETSSMMMMMMMIMMMNCFCGMVDRRKTFSLISSRDHCQRSSPSRISDTPRVGFEPAQNLSSGLVEWNCAMNLQFTLWIMIWKVISFKYLIFATYCGTRCYALWPDGVSIS